MATDMLMSPVRPGEILLADFLEPLGESVSAGQGDGHAHQGDQRHRSRAAPHQRRHGAAARPLFGTSERFWMNLQLRYDIEIEKDRLERS